MPIKSFRPLTPSGRFTSLNHREGLSKERPQRALTESYGKSGGRNVYGRVTSRHRGGGHKRLYRVIDFKRSVLDLKAKVQAIEYDPNRTSNLALLAYTNGDDQRL
jgi:large subunit ribosomal protein L2